MLTVRYDDARQADSADNDGAVHVSKPRPVATVLDEADGYATGVAGSAAAGVASITASTTPPRAATPIAWTPRRSGRSIGHPLALSTSDTHYGRLWAMTVVQVVRSDD
jgi:hypothetical protein